LNHIHQGYDLIVTDLSSDAINPTSQVQCWRCRFTAPKKPLRLFMEDNAMCGFAYVNLLYEKVRQSQVEERRIATNDLYSMNASCRGSRRHDHLQRLNPI